MKPNLAKANAAIDDYLRMLVAAPHHDARARVASRPWLDECLARAGVVKIAEPLDRAEGAALWFACLVHTHRVREVSDLERRYLRTGRTARHIELMRTPGSSHYNGVIAQALRRILQSVQPLRRAS